MASLTALNVDTGENLLLEVTQVETAAPETPSIHNSLSDRAVADCHPIGSISGLETKLIDADNKISTLSNDIADLGNIQNQLSNTVGDKADLPDSTRTVCQNIDSVSSTLDMVDFKVNQNTSSVSTLANNQGDMSYMPMGNGSDIAENMAYLNGLKQNKTDSSLTTNSKQIVGAINEIKEQIANPPLEYVSTILCGNDNKVEIPLLPNSNYKIYCHFIMSVSGDNLDLNFAKDNVYNVSAKYNYIINRWSSAVASSVVNKQENDTKIRLNALPLPSGYVEFEIDLMSANSLNYPILKSEAFSFDAVSGSIVGNKMFGAFEVASAQKIKISSTGSNFNNVNNVQSRVVIYKYRG